MGGRSVWWYRSGRLRGHGYLSPVHRRPAVAVSLEGRVRGFQGCGGGQARAAHCNRFRGGLALLLSRARGEDGSRPVGEAGRRVHAPVRGVGGGDGELVKKNRRRRPDIPRTIEPGCSNARLEAFDNRIKVTIRMAYGFHRVTNLIALIMLRCSGLDIRLPQPTI